jgi:hypothetical protein
MDGVLFVVFSKKNINFSLKKSQMKVHRSQLRVIHFTTNTDTSHGILTFLSDL